MSAGTEVSDFTIGFKAVQHSAELLGKAIFEFICSFYPLQAGSVVRCDNLWLKVPASKGPTDIYRITVFSSDTFETVVGCLGENFGSKIVSEQVFDNAAREASRKHVWEEMEQELPSETSTLQQRIGLCNRKIAELEKDASRVGYNGHAPNDLRCRAWTVSPHA
jgi:hypothetical protein